MRIADVLPAARALLVLATSLAGLVSILGSLSSDDYDYESRPDNPMPTLPAPESQLMVRADSLGAGTIDSTPAGIDGCRQTCTARFAVGTDVTLTARPDPLHTFGRWSGACAGTAAMVQVRLDQSKGCTATFGPGWQLQADNAKASALSHLRAVAAVSRDGRLRVGYLQRVGPTSFRVGALREGSDGTALLVSLGDVNANASWSATDLDLALDADDQPILAMLVELNDIAVARWNDVNRQWDVIATRLNLSAGAAASPQIAVAGTTDQTIFVAWVEAGQIVVRRYTVATASWSAAAFIPGATDVRSIRMALDPGGAPVIAYWSGTLNVIREATPGTWVTLGGAINGLPTDVIGASRFGLHVDSAGTASVAWVEGIDGISPWAVYARTFDGVSWVSPFAARPNGFVYDSAANTRQFPHSLVVARHPARFTFVVAWERFSDNLSEVFLVRPGTSGSPEVNPVPTGIDGRFRRVAGVSLALHDAERAIVAASYHEPTVAPPDAPYVIQVRRYFP